MGVCSFDDEDEDDDDYCETVSLEKLLKEDDKDNKDTMGSNDSGMNDPKKKTDDSEFEGSKEDEAYLEWLLSEDENPFKDKDDDKDTDKKDKDDEEK
jgi:hypothetical protein